MNEKNFAPRNADRGNEAQKDKVLEKLILTNNEDKAVKIESFSDFDYEKNRQIGKQMFLALNSINKEDAESYRVKHDLAWEQASKNLSSFTKLKDSSDEQLKGEYYDALINQSSSQYVGEALVSLDSLATRQGFYEGLNGKEQEKDQSTSEAIEFLNRLKKLGFFNKTEA